MPPFPAQQQEYVQQQEQMQQQSQQPFAGVFSRSQSAYQRASPRREVHFERSRGEMYQSSSDMPVRQSRHDDHRASTELAALDDLVSLRQHQEDELSRWTTAHDSDWMV